ncbi:MAG: response regulator transcription factor [Rhodomicrobium sp.]|nr:response regulator transcription factor [Rhodomicrobium sp.]
MHRPIRVAVVDDHPLFRDGVTQTFSECEEIELVASGGTCDDAVQIVKQVRPDVLLLDIQLPGGGIEAAKCISGMSCETKVVMLTASENEADVSAALEAGAAAYVLKGVSGRDLIHTVRAVLKGDTYVTPSLAARMLKNLHAKPSPMKPEKSAFVLTPREEDILDCVSVGQTNKEIAIQLNISEKTVKHYMTTIMHKLQVRNRVEAALKARQRSNADQQAAT